MNSQNSKFHLSSVNSGKPSFASNQNWEFSITSLALLGDDKTVNLNSMWIASKLKEHFFRFQFTPGISQQFLFNSRTEFIVGDTVQTYKTNLNYKEKYGFEYNYEFMDNFIAGFNVRYFQQEFSEEFPIFSTLPDSQLIDRGEVVFDKNYWRGDLTFGYSPIKNLVISLATQNLMILKNYPQSIQNSEFEIEKGTYNLNTEKSVLLSTFYQPFQNFGFGFDYETTNSFNIGLNYSTNILGSNFTIGSQIFHDKTQEPFIAGILPSLNYASDYFSVTLAYLKYFSDRSIEKSVEELRQSKISNIQNNRFSNDKIALNLNVALSFKNPQLLKFIDVEISENIYPTFTENYLDKPFAKARVVNLTSDELTIKPSSFIKEINNEQIFSPFVKVSAFDTVEVPFFTIINEGNKDFQKTQIAQANFYLTTKYSEPDDQFQKPLLINGKNSWDGKVINLKYFVKSDVENSNKIAKTILNENKLALDTATNELKIFETVKLLFNELVNSMNYVSDRRATVEYVQFPHETNEIKGGDCDDLSVWFSSVLESVGIQTAFIDYKPTAEIGHVTLMVNTKLSPDKSSLITINDKKYFVRKTVGGKEEIWLPIEMTSFTNFNEAWNLGASEFYKKAVREYGLSKSEVEIFDIY